MEDGRNRKEDEGRGGSERTCATHPKFFGSVKYGQSDVFWQPILHQHCCVFKYSMIEYLQFWSYSVPRTALAISVELEM